MLTSRLPERIESGAVKRIEYSTEIVDTDGGIEQRNSRWLNGRAEWDCSIPPCARTHADFTDTLALFHAAMGSGDTFEFHDLVDCADVEVRFKDDTLTINTIGNMVATQFTLIEVKAAV